MDGQRMKPLFILPDNIFELLLGENENDSELEEDSEGESEEDEEY